MTDLLGFHGQRVDASAHIYGRLGGTLALTAATGAKTAAFTGAEGLYDVWAEGANDLYIIVSSSVAAQNLVAVSNGWCIKAGQVGRIAIPNGKYLAAICASNETLHYFQVR